MKHILCKRVAEACRTKDKSNGQQSHLLVIMSKQHQKTVAVVGGVVTVVLLGIFFYYKSRKSRSKDDRNPNSLAAETEEINNSKDGITSAFQNYVEIEVPKHVVGTIIGKNGTQIRKLKSEFGVRFDFEAEGDKDEDENKESRKLVIKGHRDKVHAATLKINSIIEEAPKYVKTAIFVPEEACGRIIGKGGQNIRSMIAASGAKIEVERDNNSLYEGNKRKIYLSGNTVQVDYAKVLIREKVEEAIYFEEKYRKKEGSNNIPLVSLPCTEEFFKVFVSAVDSPNAVWIQLVTEESTQLDLMNKSINEVYTSSNQSMKLHKGRVGDACIAPFHEDDQYYRSKITNINRNGTANLLFIDFGDRQTLPIDSLREIREEFLTLPQQSVCCSLDAIQKDTNGWSSDIINELESLTYCATWKHLLCKVIQQPDIGPPIIQLVDPNFDNRDVIMELKAKGDIHNMLKGTNENKNHVSRNACQVVTDTFERQNEDSQMAAENTILNSIKDSNDTGPPKTKTQENVEDVPSKGSEPENDKTTDTTVTEKDTTSNSKLEEHVQTEQQLADTLKNQSEISYDKETFSKSGSKSTKVEDKTVPLKNLDKDVIDNKTKDVIVVSSAPKIDLKSNKALNSIESDSLNLESGDDSPTEINRDQRPPKSENIPVRPHLVDESIMVAEDDYTVEAMSENFDFDASNTETVTNASSSLNKDLEKSFDKKYADQAKNQLLKDNDVTIDPTQDSLGQDINKSTYLSSNIDESSSCRLENSTDRDANVITPKIDAKSNKILNSLESDVLRVKEDSKPTSENLVVNQSLESKREDTPAHVITPKVDAKSNKILSSFENDILSAESDSKLSSENVSRDESVKTKHEDTRTSVVNESIVIPENSQALESRSEKFDDLDVSKNNTFEKTGPENIGNIPSLVHEERVESVDKEISTVKSSNQSVNDHSRHDSSNQQILDKSANDLNEMNTASVNEKFNVVDKENNDQNVLITPNIDSKSNSINSLESDLSSVETDIKPPSANAIEIPVSIIDESIVIPEDDQAVESMKLDGFDDNTPNERNFEKLNDELEQSNKESLQYINIDVTSETIIPSSADSNSFSESFQDDFDKESNISATGKISLKSKYNIDGVHKGVSDERPDERPTEDDELNEEEYHLLSHDEMEDLEVDDSAENFFSLKYPDREIPVEKVTSIQNVKVSDHYPSNVESKDVSHKNTALSDQIEGVIPKLLSESIEQKVAPVQNEATLTSGIEIARKDNNIAADTTSTVDSSNQRSASSVLTESLDSKITTSGLQSESIEREEGENVVEIEKEGMKNVPTEDDSDKTTQLIVKVPPKTHTTEQTVVYVNPRQQFKTQEISVGKSSDVNEPTAASKLNSRDNVLTENIETKIASAIDDSTKEDINVDTNVDKVNESTGTIVEHKDEVIAEDAFASSNNNTMEADASDRSRLLSFDDDFVDIDVSSVNGTLTAIVSERLNYGYGNSVDNPTDMDEELQRSLDATSRKNVFATSMEMARENLLSISTDDITDSESYATARSVVTITDTDDASSFLTATEGRATPTSSLNVSVPDLSSSNSMSNSANNSGALDRNRSSSKFEIQFIDESTNSVLSRESLSASVEAVSRDTFRNSFSEDSKSRKETTV